MDICNKDIYNETVLIEKVKNNSDKFELLYNKYFEQIFRYIYKRTVNKTLSKDLTQQTFLKAFVNIKKYKPQGKPFSAWLYKIAFNEINLYYRKTKREKTYSITSEIIENIYQEIENEAEISDEKLFNVLNLLDANEMHYIELRFFEKLSFKEIALIKDETADNSKVKTYRIIKKLKELF